MINYYEVLELEDFADIEAIKAAHRKLSKVYHPDLNNGSKYHEEKFKEIQHAYEQLRDPEAKAWYDETLKGHYTGVDEDDTDDMYNTPGAGYTGRPFEYETPDRPSGGTFRFVHVPVFMFILFAMRLVWQGAKAYNAEHTPVYQINIPGPIRDPGIDTSPPTIRSMPRFKSPAPELVPRYAPPDFKKAAPVYFKIGATLEEVYKVQGAPITTIKYKGEEMWSYGNSVVTFKAGVVISYNNIDGNLHVPPE